MVSSTALECFCRSSAILSSTPVQSSVASFGRCSLMVLLSSAISAITLSIGVVISKVLLRLFGRARFLAFLTGWIKVRPGLQVLLRSRRAYPYRRAYPDRGCHQCLAQRRLQALPVLLQSGREL